MTENTETIRATINGELRELPASLTVLGLLEHFSLDGRHTAVERNRQLVPRDSFGSTTVADGDVIEIVTLVGGG